MCLALATISDGDIIQKIVSGNGVCPGDENGMLGPVIRIVLYTNIADERVWGIVYASEGEQRLWDKYMVTSEYLCNPVEVWRHPDVIINHSGYATLPDRLS